MSQDFMQQWGQPTQSYQNIMQNSKSIVPGMEWQNQMPDMGGDVGAAPDGGSPGFSFWGGTDENGIKTNSGAALGLGAAQGLFKGWMGLQQLDLAKKQLGENKRQFNMNWGAQKSLTNSRLRDRQIRRASGNPNVQSPDAYMKQWGVE